MSDAGGLAGAAVDDSPATEIAGILRGIIGVHGQEPDMKRNAWLILALGVALGLGAYLFLRSTNRLDAAPFYGAPAAIDGYDPVAYFDPAGPKTGDPRFEWTWAQTRWRFATADNRERFKAAPTRYAPQYGGYCAWAMSEGYVAKIDPLAWSIVDDKLYLNFDLATRAEWLPEAKPRIERGDVNWLKSAPGRALEALSLP